MTGLRGSCLRPFTAYEVETVLEELHARFARAYDIDEDGSHDEARLMLVAKRCVKTVLDMLKLPADNELLLKWKETRCRTGWTVEDSSHQMVARSGYDGTKHVSHIAKMHEIWRRAVMEFGGAK